MTYDSVVWYLRMVDIMSNNSISVSFTGGLVGCIMYTSLPRTFSLITTLTSPSANRDTLIFPKLIPR